MNSQPAALTFRPYRTDDFAALADLWTSINRELAPPGMAEVLERYITSIISGELTCLRERFDRRQHSQFWVVELAARIVGCFGIERRDADRVELRRMYLDRRLRGTGTAERMLKLAEEAAAGFGYRMMILSTAEIQRAALRFYEKQGYRLVRTEVASAMSVKTVGGGLTRYHFEKGLGANQLKTGVGQLDQP